MGTPATNAIAAYNGTLTSKLNPEGKQKGRTILKNVAKIFGRHTGIGFTYNTVNNLKEVVKEHPATLFVGTGGALIYSTGKTIVQNFQKDTESIKEIKNNLPKIEIKC